MNNKRTITCNEYPDFIAAHTAHLPDFVVYMFDVLPIDELCVPGIRSYIGSAGANANRTKETKSADKGHYFKSTLDGRYRSGSYTQNHTRPQKMCIFTVSSNEILEGETKTDHCKRVNIPGYKSTERELLGILEYQLHQASIHFGLTLNNNEIPKCRSSNEYARMDFPEFFAEFDFIGNVPFIVQLALGEISLKEVREQQKQHAIRVATDLLQQHAPKLLK